MAQITVIVPAGQITDLYDASGISTSETLTIQNIGVQELQISENSDMDGANILQPRSEPWENAVPGSAYAYSVNATIVSVSVDAFKPAGGGGGEIPSGLFNGSQPAVSINSLESAVRNGRLFYTLFSYPDANPIPSGQSRYFLFNVGNVDLSFKLRIVNYVGEEFSYEIFTGYTISDNGTELNIANYSSVNPQASAVTCFKDPTVTDDGTPSANEPEYYFGSSSASGRSVASFVEGVEKHVGGNISFLVKITNTGGGSGRFSWFGVWVEEEPAP